MATYSTPIPGVPQYGQASLIAKNAYQTSLARLNQRRSSLLRQSGFAGNINAETGVVDNVHVDGTNQYGALQQLNRSQAQRDEAARMQGVERGLGTGGGLAAQHLNQERFAFGKEDADLGQGLIDSLAGFQDEQNTAGYQRDAALWQAEQEAARSAIQNGEFNPADFSGVDDAPPPASPSAPARITNQRQMELAAEAKVKAAKKKPVVVAPKKPLPPGQARLVVASKKKGGK